MSKWKTIPEFPEYEANAKGIVRNIKSGHVLRQIYDPTLKKEGHSNVYVVGMRQGGKRIHMAVWKIMHQLKEAEEAA